MGGGEGEKRERVDGPKSGGDWQMVEQQSKGIRKASGQSEAQPNHSYISDRIWRGGGAIDAKRSKANRQTDGLTEHWTDGRIGYVDGRTGKSQPIPPMNDTRETSESEIKCCAEKWARNGREMREWHGGGMEGWSGRHKCQMGSKSRKEIEKGKRMD
ncbi:hypothetical protein niasHT_026436 [Heterodera trifolii]|uniref:Uncharacterized protein n=1 Tax=Heterodera trifolii TaxID=157864 RepID=A0ABD2KJH4_9BILA